MSSSSCLIKKLSHYVELSQHDRDLLQDLEKSSTAVSAGTHLREGGQAYDDLFVLSEGWLYSFTILPDGRRQVLQVFVPGDIVGIYDTPFAHATHDLAAATDAVVCPFPKDGLDPIFSESPALTGLMFTFALIDQAVFLDRLRALGRMDAVTRVGHFLFTVISRLRLTDHDTENGHYFPLTQSDVADATGLTNVSVSKAASVLREKGFAHWSNRRLTILDETRLVEFASFINRYENIDISWFPQPGRLHLGRS